MPHFLKTIWPMTFRPRTLICLLLAGVLAGLTPLIAQAGKKEAEPCSWPIKAPRLTTPIWNCGGNRRPMTRFCSDGQIMTDG